MSSYILILYCGIVVLWKLWYLWYCGNYGIVVLWYFWYLFIVVLWYFGILVWYFGILVLGYWGIGGVFGYFPQAGKSVLSDDVKLGMAILA